MFLLKSGLFYHTWGQFSSNPSTFLSSHSHFPHPSQKSFEQSKEMTFDRRLANVIDPVFRGFIAPPLKI